MPSTERTPSLVALAAASEALETAASQVARVREWMERLVGGSTDVAEGEALSLWVFAERARRVAERLEDDADRLAKVLTSEFLTARGEWPLSPEQERELHEVLATLSARETDLHREKLGDRAVSSETATTGDVEP